ncbi:ankyrin repeat domain-containing protein, partial [Wolbachia endosymbiont of Atemnus politus]|nr:ankyrin repeat domain-containing protein [Wolbachia endosymbiont of Atemnus politus]
MAASRYREEKIVKALIEGGADVNAVDKDKRTTLH